MKFEYTKLPYNYFQISEFKINEDDLEFSQRKHHNKYAKTVSIYYEAKLKQEVLEKINGLLSDTGWRNQAIDTQTSVYKCIGYHFKGCRTDKHRQDKIDFAEKRADEILEAWPDKYKETLIKRHNDNAERFASLFNERTDSSGLSEVVKGFSVKWIDGQLDNWRDACELQQAEIMVKAIKTKMSSARQKYIMDTIKKDNWEIDDGIIPPEHQERFEELMKNHVNLNRQFLELP